MSLACLARDGHDVIDADIDAAKLGLIRLGKTPVVEVGMVQLMQDAVASGRVNVPREYRVAIVGSEVTLICVGTLCAAHGYHIPCAVLRRALASGAAL